MAAATLANAEALARIFSSDYRWLTQRLRYRLGCPHNAEDVASESFLRLSVLPALEGVREPRAMLTTIANRVLYDQTRRRALERAYLEALAQAPEVLQPSPEERLLLLETLTAIDRALSALSSNARRAFLYSQLDGMTYAQIATELGVSASRVRQYMTKALTECYRVTTDADL